MKRKINGGKQEIKRKVLYICLGVSIFINGSLGRHILEREPVCERMHWSDADRIKNVVSVEEIAIKLAETYLDTGETFFGLSKDIYYDIQVVYDEQSYGWIISFIPMEEEEHIWSDAVKYVWIRKDYGTMDYIH